MGKKLRRLVKRIDDLTARMDARERAAVNLLVSLETTDAAVRDLTDMQESMKSISKTHTLWLDRLGKRIATLEDRLSPPSESTETSFVHCRAKETSPGAVSKTVAAVSAPGEDLIDFGLWLSEELTGRPISRADLESCLTDWKASR